ncbi:MAG: glycosyltransferase family 1 protein [Thermicanus sp.]|nr:glycosyltransferase family 1 protein [Thermicanus sp.]
MKVMLAPIEIAGQMGILAKGLTGIGITAAAYNTFYTYLGYRDPLFNVDAYELERIIPDAVRYFDLFHFHHGATLAPRFLDLKEIKRMKKGVVMHHWGNDVRVHAIASQKNPYVYTGDSPPPETIDATLKEISRFVEHAVVQDYEVYAYLLPYYKKIHLLPLAFSVFETIPRYPGQEEREPLILHAPTQPLFKGTKQIEEALARLKEKGLSFRYRRIEGMSNREALQAYREADLIIDQILCGSYGLLSVEGMSLGKPVVAYIREDLKGTYPEVPPIASAHPGNIIQVLEELIRSPSLRRELGEKGRKYAERVHDIRQVTQGLLRIYNQVIGG